LTILVAVVAALIGVLRAGRPIPSLNPHGGRFGLPADFLIAGDGRVLACKYGAHADDQWSVDELLAIAGRRVRSSDSDAGEGARSSG
jgi:hypothetical protein